MTMPADLVVSLPADEHRRQSRRAVVAGTLGLAVEWYDFNLYSIVTGLVFARLFFPRSDPLVGTLNAFAVYAVGFLARPVGAAIFGHYGDRLGRKAALVASLLMMGVSTFLVALVPTYERIGIWGAVALTVLRFVQGVGVGGEWGGSVLMAMEWAQTNRHRGFITAWPQFGVPVGLFLANLAVLGASAWSGDQFLTWGWRVPFLFSLVLVAVGLYVRLGIREPPVFARLRAEGRTERAPLVAVLRRHPREIMLTALCRMGEQAPYYIFTAFVFAYGTEKLQLPRNLLLAGVLAASAVSLVTVPLFGHLSDRIGRKRVYQMGAIVTAVFGFVYFAVLNTRTPTLVFAAIALSLVPHDMLYGPQAALIAETFPARLRYSGASLGYQLSSVIAGGPAPLIATWLVAVYGSATPIAVYILLCAIVTLAATAFIGDYTNRDIADE